MTISININDEDATETLLTNVGSIKSRLKADKSLSNHLIGFSGLSGSNDWRTGSIAACPGLTGKHRNLFLVA